LPLRVQQHAPKPNPDSTRIPIKRSRSRASRARTATHMVPSPVPRALIVTKGSTAPLDPQVAPSAHLADMAMPLDRHRKQAAASVSLASTPTLKVLPSASHAQEAKHHLNLALLFAWFPLQESTAHRVTRAWIVILAPLPLRERQHALKPNLDSTRIPIKRSRSRAWRARTAALMAQSPVPRALIVTKGSTAPLDPQVAPSAHLADMAMSPDRRRKQAAASVSLASTPTLKALPSASHALDHLVGGSPNNLVVTHASFRL
jgi:K+-transporting ATPase c subunit